MDLDILFDRLSDWHDVCLFVLFHLIYISFERSNVVCVRSTNSQGSTAISRVVELLLLLLFFNVMLTVIRYIPIYNNKNVRLGDRNKFYFLNFFSFCCWWRLCVRALWVSRDSEFFYMTDYVCIEPTTYTFTCQPSGGQKNKFFVAWPSLRSKNEKKKAKKKLIEKIIECPNSSNTYQINGDDARRINWIEYIWIYKKKASGSLANIKP